MKNIVILLTLITLCSCSHISANNDSELHFRPALWPLTLGKMTFIIDKSLASKKTAFIIGQAYEAVEKVHGQMSKARIYIKYVPKHDSLIKGRMIKVQRGYLIILYHPSVGTIAHELSHVNLRNKTTKIPQIIDEGIALVCQTVSTTNKVTSFECSNNLSIAHNDGQLSTNLMIQLSQYHCLQKAFWELYKINPNVFKKYYSSTRTNTKLLSSWTKSLALFKFLAPKWDTKKHHVLSNYSKPEIFWVIITKYGSKRLIILYRNGAKSLGCTTITIYHKPFGKPEYGIISPILPEGLEITFDNPRDKYIIKNINR